MTDDSLIGVKYPGFDFPVERGKVLEFARAVQVYDAAYTEDPRPVITPTWLMTSGTWTPAGLRHPVSAIDFDPARLLHAGQEFRFFGPPPRAGDVLTTESWIDRLYEKEGKRGGKLRFAEIVTSYRDGMGELVAEGRTTVIETSKPASDGS